MTKRKGQHGGKRKGAGRKVSAVTKKTRAIAEKLIEQSDVEGLKTPLEIMLDNARYFDQQARDAEAAIKLLQPDILKGIEDPEMQFAYMMAEVKKAACFRDRSQTCAEGAARFLHAPIASVPPAHGDKEFVPLHERLAAYERKDAIAASEGKVIELKRVKRK